MLYPLILLITLTFSIQATKTSYSLILKQNLDKSPKVYFSYSINGRNKKQTQPFNQNLKAKSQILTSQLNTLNLQDQVFSIQNPELSFCILYSLYHLNHYPLKRSNHQTKPKLQDWAKLKQLCTLQLTGESSSHKMKFVLNLKRKIKGLQYYKSNGKSRSFFQSPQKSNAVSLNPISQKINKYPLNYNNQLSFKDFKINQTENHIQKVRLLQSIDNSIEYIKNGDFSNNTCPSWTSFCIWYASDFMPYYLPYWTPLPDVEIGQAENYKPGSGPGYVVELAANQPTCYKQLVQNVPVGTYALNYVYSPRARVQLQWSQIYVYINETIVDERRPVAYDWNNITINITIQTSQSFYLKFCGNSSLNNQGNLLRSVSFKRFADIPIVTPGSNSNTNLANSTASSGTTVSANNTVFSNTTSSSGTTVSANNTVFSNTTNSSGTTGSANNTVFSNTTNSSGTTASANNTVFSITTNSSGTGSANATAFSNTTNLSGNTGSANSTNSFINIFNAQNNSNASTALQNTTFDDNNATQKEFIILKQQAQFSQSFQLMLNLTLSNSIISRVIQIPTIRKLFDSCFGYFINLDHLWLYIYHQRHYGLHFKKLLTEIHNLEEIKWDFIPTYFSSIGVKIDQAENQLECKNSSKPSSFYQISKNSRQFFPSNLSFFIINIPATLLTFLFLKIIHKIFSKVSFGGFLRKFGRYSLFIIILLEGSSESFTYFLLSDMTTLYSHKFEMKLLNFLSIFSLFILVFLLMAGPFILRSLFEKKKNTQFYEKCSNSLRGSVFFMVEFGLFNLVLGSVHLLTQRKPFVQLVSLFIAQALFIAYLTMNFRRGAKVYQSKFDIFVMIWASFLRMNLIFSSYLFEISYDTLTGQIQHLQQVQIILYLLLWIVSILYSSVNQIFDRIIFLMKKLIRWLKKIRNIKKKVISQVVNKKRMQQKQLQKFREVKHYIFRSAIKNDTKVPLQKISNKKRKEFKQINQMEVIKIRPMIVNILKESIFSRQQKKNKPAIIQR